MWLCGGDQAHDRFLGRVPPNNGMQRAALRAAAESNRNSPWRGVVTRAEAPREFELRVSKADADWEGTVVGFELSPRAAGTWVRFYHRGWRSTCASCVATSKSANRCRMTAASKRDRGVESNITRAYCCRVPDRRAAAGYLWLRFVGGGCGSPPQLICSPSGGRAGPGRHRARQ
jgi:hypothetical protein